MSIPRSPRAFIGLKRLIKTGSSLYMWAGSGDHEFLSWDEVIEMHHAGIDFGSHGVNHLILDKNGVDIDFELKQSKIDIEARLSAPITAFSYPNGNYDPNDRRQSPVTWLRSGLQHRVRVQRPDGKQVYIEKSQCPPGCRFDDSTVFRPYLGALVDNQNH